MRPARSKTSFAKLKRHVNPQTSYDRLVKLAIWLVWHDPARITYCEGLFFVVSLTSEPTRGLPLTGHHK